MCKKYCVIKTIIMAMRELYIQFIVIVIGDNRRGAMPQIPQRVQQAVGQAVAQVAVNELTNAFANRFK